MSVSLHVKKHESIGDSEFMLEGIRRTQVDDKPSLSTLNSVVVGAGQSVNSFARKDFMQCMSSSGRKKLKKLLLFQHGHLPGLNVRRQKFSLLAIRGCDWKNDWSHKR